MPPLVLFEAIVLLEEVQDEALPLGADVSGAAWPLDVLGWCGRIFAGGESGFVPLGASVLEVEVQRFVVGDGGWVLQQGGGLLQEGQAGVLEVQLACGLAVGREGWVVDVLGWR